MTRHYHRTGAGFEPCGKPRCAAPRVEVGPWSSEGMSRQELVAELAKDVIDGIHQERRRTFWARWLKPPRPFNLGGGKHE